MKGILVKAMIATLAVFLALPMYAETEGTAAGAEEKTVIFTAAVDYLEYYKDQAINTGNIQPSVSAEAFGFAAGFMINYDMRGLKEITEAKTTLGCEFSADIFEFSAEYAYRAFFGAPASGAVCENEISISAAADIFLCPSVSYTRCVLGQANSFYAGLSHSFEVNTMELTVSPVLEYAMYEGYSGITQIETEISSNFDIGSGAGLSASAIWSLSFDHDIYENGLYFGLSLGWEGGI